MAGTGRLRSKIGRLIGNHVEDLGLGDTYAAETGFIVERDPDTVRGADVGIRASRTAGRRSPKPEKHIPFAPDLAVEVLSSNDRDDEVEEKVQLWLRAGSLLVWMVDPETAPSSFIGQVRKPVTLQRTTRRSTAARSIPGFRCRVADFFA